MSEELKPCPFCGSKAIIALTINTQMYFVQCNNADCMAEGPYDLGKSGAIEAWQSRPREDELQRQLDEANELILKLRKAVVYYGDQAKTAINALSQLNSARNELAKANARIAAREPDTHTHDWITVTEGSRWFCPTNGSVEDNLTERVICSICGVEMPEQPPAPATPDDELPI